MQPKTILIADIDDTKRLRPLDMARVEAYAASIEDSRLIQPIVVRRNVGEYLGEKTYVLTAGGHRLAALKLLGWTELTIGDHVVIRDETAADAETSEVIENIFQPGLNAVDRIIFLGKAKELHDAKRIETRGRKRKDADFKDKKIMADSAIISSPRFTKEIAAKIGLAETVIKEACRIAKALDPEAIAAIRGTMLEDNQVELRALAALAPEQQRVVAGFIKAGTSRNVLQATWAAKIEKEPLNDPQARILATLLDQFGKASKQTRAQFMKAAALSYRKDEDAKSASFSPATASSSSRRRAFSREGPERSSPNARAALMSWCSMTKRGWRRSLTLRGGCRFANMNSPPLPPGAPNNARLVLHLRPRGARAARLSRDAGRLGADRAARGLGETAQRAMVDAALARGLGHGAMDILKGGAREGAQGAHSETSLETQGNSAGEIREIQTRAAELSRSFRAFDQTQIETMLGDAKTFVGSLDHAMAAMPDILKLRTIQQGQHGHTSDEEFNSLIKALEVGGVTADESKMHERLETFAKIMNVFKETIHPGDFSSFYNQAGIAARTLSDRFMRGAGAHLMQEMGGGGAGNAVIMFMNALEAGTMQPKAMETMDRLGLLDDAKVRRKPNGEIRWIDPGGVKGGDLARADPDRWVDEKLRPALEKLAPEKRDEAELALFSNSSVRKLVDKILNQKSVVDKDFAQVEAAPGLEASDIWGGKDPALAAHAVGAQFENLLRDAGKPLMGAATGLMNWLSGVEAGLGRVAEDHPWAATTAGLATAAAGFWASLKLAQAAMTKAAGWWGRGAATGADAGPGATAIEEAARGAQSPLASPAGPKGAAADLSPNAAAMEGFKNSVSDLAANGGNVQALSGDSLQTFQKAHPAARARMLDQAADAAKNAGESAPETAASPEASIWESLGGKAEVLSKAAAVGKVIRGGVVGALVGMGAEWALGKGEEKLFGWTPENTAKAEDNIHAKAKEWFDSLFAGTQEASKGLDETKQKADAAGEAIKAGLDVSVTPKVDLSHFDALDARIAQSTANLQKLGALATSVPSQGAQSLRRGYSPGTHALHDGSELY